MVTTVPVAHLPVIRERVEKVNKRAAKIGVEGLALDVSEVREHTERDHLGFEHTYRVADVEVVGPPVKFEGWTFAASIDHRESLVYSAPDVEGDFRSYADTATCEHCQHNRRRNRTFILRHDDGTEKQVGSTCLKDFLGHDVSVYVRIIDAFSDFDEFLGGGFGAPDEWGLREFLSLTEKIIRVHGWTSRSRAVDGPATADLVLDFLTARSEDVCQKILGGTRHAPATIEDECYEEAERAIEWFAGVTPRSDYEHNLATIVSNGFVTFKSAGLAASLMSAYRRERQKQIEREAEAEDRTPVPDTTERIEVAGTITKVDFKEGDWGTRTVITVSDDRGFRVWGTKPSALHKVPVGSKIRFTARIERSRNDETFGYFTRPTKAEVIEEAVEVS